MEEKLNDATRSEHSKDILERRIEKKKAECLRMEQMAHLYEDTLKPLRVQLEGLDYTNTFDEFDSEITRVNDEFKRSIEPHKEELNYAAYKKYFELHANKA